MNRDNIYDHLQQQVLEPFSFNEGVSAVFADMIERSVPGYALTLDMLGVIANRYGQGSGNVYDLGCSLGASTLALRHNLRHTSCRVVAIDNSPAMIERCRQAIDEDQCPVPVEVREEDILTTGFSDVRICVLNFVLQFVDANERTNLLRRIASATQPGGILILSEKVIAEDQADADLLIDLHHEFKRHKGYSDLEIARKRTALENVLVPETIASHQQRLLSAGFSRAVNWFRCFNFVSILAIKEPG